MNKRWFGVFVAVLILAVLLSACGANSEKSDEKGEAAKPSNSGGPGQAVNLKGDATRGATLFADNCAKCHGEQGKGGIDNPGSKDGTVPPLSPIDSSMVSSDYKTFATNIDLFIEHGSTPEPAKEGDTPTLQMINFGDSKQLQPQDIADLIAYIISLNQK